MSQRFSDVLRRKFIGDGTILFSIFIVAQNISLWTNKTITFPWKLATSALALAYVCLLLCADYCLSHIGKEEMKP